MANSRKTQGEIDRLLKKITEGMDVYEDTYEKFGGASSISLKERFESELKKEIKKLQRLREQIKALTTSGEVKDKKALEKARKDIEGKMEAFKGVEKETKTKTYSKEGLANGARLDPTEAAKHVTSTWIREAISELMSQIETLEFDIESEGGNKRKGRGGFDPKEERLTRNRFHVVKLEQLLRLMDNDELDAADIDEIQDDVTSFVEANEDEDYVEDFEDLYECFDLPEAPVKPEDDDEDDYVKPKASPKTLKADKKATPATAAAAGGTVIQTGTPPTSKMTPKTPAAALPGKKDVPAPVTAAAKTQVPAPAAAAKKVVAQPAAAKVVPPQPAGGLVKVPNQPTLTSPKSVVPASPVRETPLPYAQVAQQAAAKQEAERKALAAAAAAEKDARERTMNQKMNQQQQQHQSLLDSAGNGVDEELTVDDLLDDDDGLNDDTFGDDAMGSAGDNMADLSAMTQGGWNKQAPLPPKPASASPNDKSRTAANGSSAAAATAAGSSSPAGAATGPAPTPAQQQAANQQQAAHHAAVTMLEQSVKNLPHPNDAERLKAYIPPNPYKTPAWYPQSIHPALTHPETLSKFEIEALFFIFYYQPNTYQQYLAAKELKKQSWRYHKKYLTWFQRHDTPKQTTDDFEQGAYIYFDFESGWCQRIKNDFTFKYQFLEDELQ